MSGYNSIQAARPRSDTDEKTELTGGENRPARTRTSLSLPLAAVSIALFCFCTIVFTRGRRNSRFVNQIPAFPSNPRSVLGGPSRFRSNGETAFTSNSRVTIFDEEVQSGGEKSTSSSVLSWLPSAVEDWMGELSDSQSIAHVSIPGTHDSAALYGGEACQTQSWSIADQLRAGIRFFDIRCRRAGNVFAIHHGPCFQEIFFGDVLFVVRDFLASHDKEFVIMNVQEEYTPMDGSSSFTSIWSTYMSEFGYLFVDARSTLPTVGEVRGKILALRPTWLSDKGIAWTSSLTDTQSTWQVYLLPSPNPMGPGTASLEQKLSLIADQIDKAATSYKLVLNFISGSVGMTPANVADYTNVHAYNHIGTYEDKKRVGVIIMDFPGEKLVYRVIKTNFESHGFCEARTFRTESDKTWAEFRLPRSVVGTSIFIRGGGYARYVFPTCHRCTWSDLYFVCGNDHSWIVSGQWDADAWCTNSNTNQNYLAVGYK